MATKVNPKTGEDIDLEEKAEELGIEHFITAVSALSIGVRGPVVPKTGIRHAQKHGSNQTGFGIFELKMHTSDNNLVPDPRSLIQLPWKPEFAWLNCNLYRDGEPNLVCPRLALVRQIEKLRELGYVMKSGVEPEFFLVDKDELVPADRRDTGEGLLRYQDLNTALRFSKVMTRISEALDTLKWGPYEWEKEAGCSQFEISFDFTDSLVTADRTTFVKSMIKALAEEEGYRATFMPLPFAFQPIGIGSGCHINVSLWRVDDDTNAFPDKTNEMGLSDVGRHFLAGIMKHLMALTAILCPTINSYKRIHVFKNFLNLKAFSVNGKYQPVRVSKVNGESDRIEMRIPDGSMNPHLAHAALIAAGIDGIINKLEPDPKEQIQGDMFSDPNCKPEDALYLPTSFLEALQALQGDAVLSESLGPEVTQSFIELAQFEWGQFCSEITDWEKRQCDMY